MTQPLILASTSPFRRELLSRLQLPFETIVPQVEEERVNGEGPSMMVRRLSEAKARAVVANAPKGALIIGSDQCALREGQIIGKPGNHERAREQLMAASGRSLLFHTGLCLLNTTDGSLQVDEVTSVVNFRRLSEEQIENYLRKEQPYGCSGSIKSEGLGIALLASIEATDPTALIGLPLMRLSEMLAAAGAAAV